MRSVWKTKLKKDPLPWLLEGAPWTRYNTLIELLDLPLSHEDVRKAKQDLLGHSIVMKLASEAYDWFPLSITRHNDPTLCYYKLRMLADFGLSKDDGQLAKLIEKAARYKENNLFAVRVCIPEETTGYPKPDPHATEWHALPCDSPLITYISC